MRVLINGIFSYFCSHKIEEMAEIQIILPKMGESVAEATITTWLKSEGDSIELDESIVEIATDKVDSEVPSPGDGILSKILVNEGEVAQVGQAIAIISTDGSDASTTSAPAAGEINKSKAQEEIASPTVTTPSSSPAIQNTNRFYSPLVKNIAQKENISQSELDAVLGTGQGGRVTKKDILLHLENVPDSVTKNKETKEASVAQKTPTKSTSSPKYNHGDNVEIIEMDRMRKLIADHMVMSKSTSPHVTSFVEADVTNLVNWRNKIKDDYFKREGEKITFTPIFIEALTKAIKDFPMINISVVDNKIIRKKDINIGMATALPNGNLIVPVIRNVDSLNLVGLSKAVNSLANKARSNKLVPDDISGGTYTITNVGGFGNIMGTPIINQPQVAIMAVGAIVKKPAVLETPDGDVIAIRHKMFLSHSYDHRVVDGSMGGMFVRRMADYLEAFDVNREL